MLASYQDNKIFLAKNDPNAEINLCANSAVMKFENDNDGDPNITWNTFKITSEHSLLLDAIGEVRVGSGYSYFTDEEDWLEHPNSYERQCSGSLYISSADKWTIDDPKNFNPIANLSITDWYDNTESYTSQLHLSTNSVRLTCETYLEDYMNLAEISLGAKVRIGDVDSTDYRSQIRLLADLIETTGDVYIPNNKAIYSYNTNGDARHMINLNTNNNLVIGYGGYSNSEGLTNLYGNGVTITAKTTIDLKGPVTFTDPAETRANLGVWMYDITTNATYPGLARPDGTTTGYVRTPQTGIIPYQNGGHGTVGTSSWPFNNGYFKNVHISDVEINSNSNIVVPNKHGIYSVSADGASNVSMLYMNSADECVLGYGGWTADVGSTRIYGKQIKAYSKDLGINFRLDRTKPYFEAGDSVSCNIYTAGYTTSSAKQIWFTVPLAKPVVGNPTVTVAWRDGIVCRQNIKYTHGSNYTNGATVWSKLGTLEGHLRADGNYMSVCATMTDTTNANNNSTIGIMASIKITFS